VSFLTPLYALGFLAITAPIIFHLIRRTPRGEVPFSSLLFLTPTPPRLTRRSRLDQWLLLILRAAALVLLAIAFMRPFLRQESLASAGEARGKRVAVLIDTSASMRRADLLPRARALAEQAVGESAPSDRLAVFAFDKSLHPLIGFDESATLDPARRQAIASSRLSSLQPSWRSTDLGRALVDALAALEDAASRGAIEAGAAGRIELITDLQQGSRLDALSEVEWPSDVDLRVKIVAHEGANAGVYAAPEGETEQPDPARPRFRVGVSNDVGSRVEEFVLFWLDERGGLTGTPIKVYVPPGASRIVPVPQPPGFSGTGALRLKGDSCDFDNTLFVAAEPKREDRVLFVGSDRPDDPSGLLYYLNRVYPQMPRHVITIRTAAASARLVFDRTLPFSLVVLGSECSTDNHGRLHTFMRGGGTLFYVIDSTSSGATLAGLLATSPRKLEEVTPHQGALLSDISFDHPLFAPLAGPQFNDYTKIRFWKYRRIPRELLGDARVLARFDSGDPAVLEKRSGKGRLIVMASGWAPQDSQLSRSSKFFPLMAALLEAPNPRRFQVSGHQVEDRVPLPERESDASEERIIIKPDGSRITLASEDRNFDATDQPGIYTLTAASVTHAFAVNLDPQESKTSPLPLETLEQLGCRLASKEPQGQDPQQLRQLQSQELEGRQQLWRWAILAVTGILVLETWLAGRAVTPRTKTAEALST
jgi:hypothetical protein